MAESADADNGEVKSGDDAWLRTRHLITLQRNCQASKEKQKKQAERVIHDAAANGLKANPYVINEKAQ